jgi:hypothetical protein
MYDELIENLRFNARQVQRFGPTAWKYGTEILLFNAAVAIEDLSRECKSLEAILGTHPDPRGEPGDPGVPLEPPEE